ncbi:MAG TPA: SLBB domain-containing protein [Opitutaceae bacterium]|jgi:protein involved in polysaccharide export with SLBB domain
MKLKSALLASAALALAGCSEVPTGPDAPHGPPPPAAAELAPVAAATPLDASLLQRPHEDYRLGPGDQIGIEVVGNADVMAAYPPSGVASVTVGPDGKVYYFLLPGIDVWGLTLGQARDRISDQLHHYLKNLPPISVSLVSAGSRRVWILGRVGSPGVYTLAGPTTLLDALANSGGLASGSAIASLASSLGVSSLGSSAGDSADLSRAFLIRDGRVVPVDFQRLMREGDLTQNVYLEPDDFVYVPSVHAHRVYVLGSVAQPGSEAMRGSLTLVQAIALSGGTVEGAYLKEVAIVRGSVSHPEIGIVSVSDILHGKALDVRLEPGDIVYVPRSPYDQVERYARLIVDTFARTVGINEGARAVSNNASGVGVGISVSP